MKIENPPYYWSKFKGGFLCGGFPGCGKPDGKEIPGGQCKVGGALQGMYQDFGISGIGTGKPLRYELWAGDGSAGEDSCGCAAGRTEAAYSEGVI